MVFKRYADPFTLMDTMISCHRFKDFVIEFINKINEEKDEQTMWEYYLHKIFDQSFEEFRASVKATNEKTDESVVADTVTKSFGMLKGFIPKP